MPRDLRSRSGGTPLPLSGLPRSRTPLGRGAEDRSTPLEDVLGALDCSHETPRVPLPSPGRSRGPLRGAPAAIGIGVSTGGPEALTTLLSSFSVQLPVPLFIVQHMPVGFVDSLVGTLAEAAPFPVHRADDEMEPVAGHAYLAPGGSHMFLAFSPTGAVLRLSQAPPEHHCRPAVDVLFRSLPDVYGSKVLAAVLTGMGSDGVDGARVIREAGGACIAQDQASSRVFGMPKAVVDAGQADEVLGLDEIAPRLEALVRRGES
ncbi:MAG TPA: chemotaxis protein CheB [Planctomycetes bacterium]|nr:chemotaxis protein CheB [Planctomycetota bacterium]